MEAPAEAPDDAAAAGFDAVEDELDEPESDDFESEDDEVDEAAGVEDLAVERESVR
ncbi:hypothetical protein AB0H83_47035 [Dactylosporangium sp. NPDC050688]|uniref:hypothetical protein n=1 Tax=Dactylosporangium sp. NPDC050688 TaxID=3157217 RepID=UPI00340F1100